MIKGLVKQVLAGGATVTTGPTATPTPTPTPTLTGDVTFPTAPLGFTPPEVNEVLAFSIRFLFIIAGLTALLYIILGALSWVTSGGNKEAVDNARNKIMSAVIGLVLIFVVLTIVVLLEEVLFPGNCGLGVSKQICFPKLIKP